MDVTYILHTVCLRLKEWLSPSSGGKEKGTYSVIVLFQCERLAVSKIP
jgi:hypothetical protein